MTLLLHNDGTCFYCDQCKVEVPRTRDNPFPEHTCGVKPLNLRAVEERLNVLNACGTALCRSPDCESARLALVLLAHCRALRAALEPFTNTYELERCGEPADQWLRPAFERAAAVLAQATDQEGT